MASASLAVALPARSCASRKARCIPRSTAWSVAAVLGPVIITELSERARAALAPGAPRVHIYDQPLMLLAGLLAVGLLLTLAVKPLRPAAA